MQSLTEQATEWRALLLCHALGDYGPDTPVIFETRLIESRYTRVPAEPCSDCAAPAPSIFRGLPEGYSAGLLITHSDTCPRLREALRHGKGGQP
jgi:hypothetical protein